MSSTSLTVTPCSLTRAYNYYSGRSDYARTNTPQVYSYRSSNITLERLAAFSLDGTSPEWAVQNLTLSWSLSGSCGCKLVIMSVPAVRQDERTAFEAAVNGRAYAVYSGSGPHSVTLYGNDAEQALTYGFALVPAEAAAESRNVTGYEAAVTYLDHGARPTASAVSPVAANILGTEAVTFRWSYDQAAGDPQTAYALQTSNDEGATWTTRASASSSATSVTVAADTFTPGAMLWRVTVYCGQLQGTSEPAPVIVRIQPSSSTVDVDNKPRLTVSWLSADQAAFQVKIGDWNSGARFGSAQSYTLPLILSDGVYPVTVRTQTSAGEWSDWTEEIWAEIANDAPEGTVSLTVRQESFSCLLSWETDTEAGIGAYVVYRDGVPVAALDGSTTRFTDDDAGGMVTYTVRALDDSGNYIESNAADQLCLIRWDCIRTKDGPWLPLKYSTDIPSRSYAHGSDVGFRHYAGREKPVAVTMGHKTRTGSFRAAFLNREPAERLLAMVGKEVVRKDSKGGVILGVMTDAVLTSEQLYAVAYSVTETDQARKGELPDDQ